MLKLTDLALRPDLQLGPMLVSPSRRLVEGPGGHTHVEPLIMQVFLLLLDAGGKVVTRNELFDQCWGGVIVGDDSLNRAIAKVRRTGAQVAPGLYEVETIPRTGYRLTGHILDVMNGAATAHAEPPLRMSRRTALIAAGATFMVAAPAGGWLALRARSERRVSALVNRAEQSVRKDMADDRTARNLQEAVSLRPDNARAWGLLAFLKSVATASADPKKAEPARNEAQEAAGKALALDPKEPYARLAMFELQGSTLDWATRDARLREIIALDPTHLPAIAELVLLTQAAGMNRESWNWNERALALNPFSLDYLSKRALKLWIAGRVPQADKVIDQVRAMYPTSAWPAWVRFLILAMTDRPRAAEAMLNAQPAILDRDEATILLWRSALRALEQGSAANIATARKACLAAAASAGSFAVDTVMILAALGEVDAAFDIANGFLLARGLLVSQGASPKKHGLNDATWRVSTQYLFTPPCRVIRADPRFLRLCEGMGLTDYWRARGVRPDYQVYG